MPELEHLLNGPRVRGALQSLLGKGYVMDGHRYCHPSGPGRVSQQWHKDATASGYTRRLLKVGRAMLMYYPTKVLLEHGPTGVIEGSQCVQTLLQWCSHSLYEHESIAYCQQEARTVCAVDLVCRAFFSLHLHVLNARIQGFTHMSVLHLRTCTPGTAQCMTTSRCWLAVRLQPRSATTVAPCPTLRPFGATRKPLQRPGLVGACHTKSPAHTYTVHSFFSSLSPPSRTSSTRSSHALHTAHPISTYSPFFLLSFS